ncbi:hypothetical protein H4R33_002899 [Dimargaris cristalligena]|nr:hypothetical protein H4R33_002899 [Dimargaris cristalligena]
MSLPLRSTIRGFLGGLVGGGTLTYVLYQTIYQTIDSGGRRLAYGLFLSRLQLQLGLPASLRDQPGLPPLTD